VKVAKDDIIEFNGGDGGHVASSEQTDSATFGKKWLRKQQGSVCGSINKRKRKRVYRTAKEGVASELQMPRWYSPAR